MLINRLYHMNFGNYYYYDYFLNVNSCEDSLGTKPFHSLSDFVARPSHHIIGFSAKWRCCRTWCLVDLCVCIFHFLCMFIQCVHGCISKKLGFTSIFDVLVVDFLIAL